MPSTRRRPETEFQSTAAAGGQQIVTLSSLTGGVNTYSNPELMSPQFWADCANVYSGLHGTVRRARWAPLVNSSTSGYTPTSVIIKSMYGAYFPLQNPWLFYDTNGLIWWLNGLSGTPVAKVATQAGTFPSLFYLPAWNLAGPFMRIGMGGAMTFQTNGFARSKIFVNSGTNAPELELWGIDAPDASPSVATFSALTGTVSTITRAGNVVTLITTAPTGWTAGMGITVSGVTDTTFNSAAGTCFILLTAAGGGAHVTYAQVGANASDSTGTATNGVTTSVGRSYQYAWENANTGQVSAPSPASQYLNLSNQTVALTAQEPGTLTITASSATITGVNTAFSTAWVGRKLALDSVQFTSDPYIVSVASATSMTVSLTAGLSGASGVLFNVYDPQATHIRFYATGDGQATYLRIGRNAIILAGGTNLDWSASLEFFDTYDSEPPNPPFTNETTQVNNVPPPIGSYLQDYQGRVLVFGVPAAPQTFFYSNIETTVVGQPPESFAPLNSVTLPIGDGQINGMANLPTGCMMWSNRQDMFKLTGTLTDNTVANAQQLGASIQRLPYRIGCASPYATTVTSLGCFWLSSDREVWLFTDHYAPKNIGKPIQNILNQATRINFARMENYKSGDRNWLALCLTIGSGTFNNLLCVLDLDLLASNGQPSFFTFDMATNQPTWYLYNVNCESIESAFDANSINHLLTGDVDVITDVDWQPTYYTVGAEQSVPSSGLTLHAIGNEDPEVLKILKWFRFTSNQAPKYLASQGWYWNILGYDDDRYVLSINPRTTKCVPGTNSPTQVVALETSPALFKFGGLNFAKGRRFQIQTIFPSTPGFYELRSFQVCYDQVTAR